MKIINKLEKHLQDTIPIQYYIIWTHKSENPKALVFSKTIFLFDLNQITSIIVITLKELNY